MATYANTTFATVTDVKRRVDDAEMPLAWARNAPDLDTKIQEKIDDTKDEEFRNDLIFEARKNFPQTAKDWVQQMQYHYNTFFGGSGRNTSKTDIAALLGILPQFGYIDIGNIAIGGEVFIGISPSDTSIDFPQTFFNNGTPDNTTLSGDTRVKNGAVLIDISGLAIEANLYINRSMVAGSPDWQIWNADDGIDFILNPTVLKLPFVYRVLARCAESGMFRNRAGYDGSYSERAHGHFMQKFGETMYGCKDAANNKITSGVASLIQWGISGSGKINDFQRRSQQPKRKLFA